MADGETVLCFRHLSKNIILQLFYTQDFFKSQDKCNLFALDNRYQNERSCPQPVTLEFNFRPLLTRVQLYSSALKFLYWQTKTIN